VFVALEKEIYARLFSFRVEFKRGCKPNIPRHFRFQLIPAAICNYAHVIFRKYGLPP